MYKNNDKRRLYWLINKYLLNEIDESTFCNEFYYSYDLEINVDVFTDNEKIFFSELNEITSRFSQYEEDHMMDSKAFSDIDELKKKIIETKIKLEGEGLF